MIVFDVDFIVLSFLQQSSLIFESASECDKKSCNEFFLFVITGIIHFA